MMSSRTSIYVRRAVSGNPARGILRFQGHVWPCLLGKNGITTRKLEGDMKTPGGKFPLLFGYFRNDRMARRACPLPLKVIHANDGWCDAPGNPNYNRPVKLPFSPSHEIIKREDALYDYVIVMDHNFTNRIKNRGSAVFFHLTAEKKYTAGCIAVAPRTMKFLLPRLSIRTKLVVTA